MAGEGITIIITKEAIEINSIKTTNIIKIMFINSMIKHVETINPTRIKVIISRKIIVRRNLGKALKKRIKFFFLKMIMMQMKM